ncbi:small RNA 2'-O-methyltransferase [Antennarius striatus]|uniref:small RNA 2'-O-methyltransferase n=1 Tax=Antennarius striatus TaxID=241820 RepID=UPI0035B33B48
MFRPSLNSQRHQFVIDFVKRNKPQKVVDLGCSECTLLKKLRFHREIELLVGVDINGVGLKRKMYGLAPLSSDYLHPGFEQLRVELYQGSVTQKDIRLRGFDLLTSIELIEHLSLPDVEKFSDVVFGYMTPMTVIVSTPNAEFNPLLPGLTGFRHRDHKFEWTRTEFQSWALKVGMAYGYDVEFTGVGRAPPGPQEGVGFCSQIAVFRRLGGRVDCSMLFSDDADEVFSYSLLYSINYPSLRDNNILRRVLVSEVLHWAEKLKTEWMEGTGGRLNALSAGGGVVNDVRLSEPHMESEETPTVWLMPFCHTHTHTHTHTLSLTAACDPEIKYVAVGLEGEDEEESCKLQRCVSVPLSSVWFSSTRIRTLSESPTKLRRFLMGDPQVKMNQDVSAVLLEVQDTEEEDQNILEDSGFADTSKNSLHRNEDWESNI